MSACYRWASNPYAAQIRRICSLDGLAGACLMRVECSCLLAYLCTVRHAYSSSSAVRRDSGASCHVSLAQVRMSDWCSLPLA